MPWARTTVTVTATSGGPGADAATAVSVTIPGNHGISNSLWTDTSVGGNVGADTLALRQNQSTSTAPTTSPVAGATFVNSTVIHTVTGYTAGTRTITFTPNLTVALTDNVSIILNPAIQVGAQAIVGTTNAVYNVRSVSNASNSVVSLYPLTGVAVPNTAAQTITFSNPIFQYGTDTTADAGLAGLANIRANLINAFVDHPTAGTYASTTTQIRIDDSNGAAPSILPVPFATFINGSGVHRITGYNSTTREITFSPGLTATLTDNAVLTIATQGVATNQGNAGTGVDVYTVYGTNVLVNGTLTWNAWSEQLVFSASCRSDDTGSVLGSIVAPLMLAGTTTINGTKSSGSVCPSPALVLNTAGSTTITFIQINSFTGSTTSINNTSILANGWVNFTNGTNTANNATFLFSSSASDVFAFTGTYTGFTNVGGRWNVPGGTGDYTLSNVVLDNAGTVTFTGITTNITVTVLDLVIRNTTTDWLQFRCISPITRGKILFLNLASGSIPSVSVFGEPSSFQGGMAYAGKSVNHSCKNLLGATLSDVKVFCADTLNGNAVNWFTTGVESAGYVRSQLSAVWNGASTRTYSWTTSASGSAASQNVVLAYYVNPNTRAINLSAFVSDPAFNGDAQIKVAAAASPTFGLFSAAPQVNGSFVNNGTRHLITTVTTNGTTDYTLSITPPLNAGIALNTRILITNLYYDIRNKTNIAAFVDNAAGYNPGATIILIDNGSGARTTIQPTVNSNFTYNGTYHNVTAVGTGTANKWQLTIQPGLSASLPDNTPITLRNIAGQDFCDFRTASYPHLPQGQELNLAGTGTLTNTWTLLDDATITQTNKATVDAYTTTTGTLSTSITSLSLASGGTGYGASITNGTLSFSGGGGSGATGTFTTNASGVITSVTLNLTGSGYTSNPTVTAPTGSGAVITALAASTAGTSGGQSVSLTFTSNLASANPALEVGAQIVLSTGLYSVTSVTNASNSVVTLAPQNNVPVPSVSAGTVFAFFNPSTAANNDYTTITTAARFYDKAKAEQYRLFEILTPANQSSLWVTRSGAVLNAGNKSITLGNYSPNSFTAVTLNESANTITINAPTFTDTLTTTGTITLNNPSASQVNYASGIVPAGGTVAVAVAGTYDLSGWTFASAGAARTISNTSGGAVTVWLNPNQVANVTGAGTSLTIVAKPQPLLAPNLADGTRAYAARVQTFTIASTAIDTSADTITLGNDSQGKAAVFATEAPWTQVAFRLAPGATLPATTGNVLKDGGFYYWSGGKLYTSIANIPGTPVDFTSQGSGNFTLQAETELFNTTVSGGSGLSQSLTQPDGILIRFKATKWSESAGNASATQFLDTRDSLITWSAFTGATVSTTLELEAVHEQIVATSYVQSGKYGQLFPAKRGDQFGGKFGIALEGVGTLQINADDDSSNPAGVELLQDIFLWWCWVRSTEAGIRLASYDTLTAINFTTYQAGRVEVENTDASVPLIIAGGSISFAGSSNGIAATSNAIYLNVDVLGVVAITGVAAADIRSAVGLGSANLDSQLGDITALVL